MGVNLTFFGGSSLGEILKGLNDQLQNKKYDRTVVSK